MKVYMIKDKTTGRYYTDKFKTFRDVEEGTIFWTLNEAKRSLGYCKRRAARYITYYRYYRNPTTQWAQDYNATWQEQLDACNRCVIDEYELSKVRELDGQGVEINTPISPKDEEVQEESFDKVDFSSI